MTKLFSVNSRRFEFWATTDELAVHRFAAMDLVVALKVLLDLHLVDPVEFQSCSEVSLLVRPHFLQGFGTKEYIGK